MDATPQGKYSRNKWLMSRNEAIRSHQDQAVYSQWVTARTAKTKPRRLLFIVSIVYGHFEPIFSQVATDGAMLYIADLGGQEGEPK